MPGASCYEAWVGITRLPKADPVAIRAGARELAVRRLFHLATHSEIFRRLMVEDDSLLDFTTALLGPDLKLVQSMALLKPPGTGEKRWHQE